MRRIFIGLLLALTSSFYFVSCSDSDSSSSSTGTSYSGFGSEWNINFGTNTFTITYAPTFGGATNLTVNGSYETLSSISNTNILSMTVTSASGTNAPAVGAKAYGILVPDFVFLLKPLDADSEIIPMLISGSCPNADVAANWISTSYDGTDDIAADVDVAGTFNWNNSTSTPTVPTAYSADGGAATGWTPPTFSNGSCSSGVLTFEIPAFSETINAFASTLGGMLVNISSGSLDDKLIVTLPQSTMALTDLEGTYDALVFDEQGVAGGPDKTGFGQVTLDATGVGTGAVYTDVDNGTLDTNTVDLDFSAGANTPSTGFILGTIDDSTNPVENLLCAVVPNANNTSKTIAFCVGASLGGATDELYNILLVER